MGSRLIKHDGFARFELYKDYHGNCGNCDNCGSNKKLFAFHTENDDSLRREKHHISGLFCSISCMRMYHSNYDI